jgi:predicted enzyme related to lactoylglutathione lyase
MPTRYAHTNIVAEDWRTLAGFYEAVFDCVPVPPVRQQNAAWLAKGTGVKDAALEGVHLRLPGLAEDSGFAGSAPTLEIYNYRQVEPRLSAAANRLGLGHLAFAVDDVQATLEAVINHGRRALGELTQAEVDGVGLLTFVYACDPEDNVLELQHWDKL